MGIFFVIANVVITLKILYITTQIYLSLNVGIYNRKYICIHSVICIYLALKFFSFKIKQRYSCLIINVLTITHIWVITSDTQATCPPILLAISSILFHCYRSLVYIFCSQHFLLITVVILVVVKEHLLFTTLFSCCIIIAHYTMPIALYSMWVCTDDWSRWSCTYTNTL